MTLRYDLEQAWNAADTAEEKKKAVVAVLKRRQDEILIDMGMVLNTPQNSGLEAMFVHADALDNTLSELMTFVYETVFQGHNPPETALVAVGGYGRKELAPYSDIDILFLLNENDKDKAQDVVSFVTSALWDTGLKVGAAVRTPADCITQAVSDITIRTNMLESRLVWGSSELFNDFSFRYEELRTSGNGRDFIESKFEERSARYLRMGLSKYMLEPNVKESRGGLRDLHLLFWLAKYLFGITQMPDLIDLGILSPVACHKFLKAHRFLATVRCHLHILSGRAGDILTFDAQAKIAEQMGYDNRTGQSAAERFMKHYYLISKTVGELSNQITVAIKDALSGEPQLTFLPEQDFYLINDRIAFKSHLHFNETPLVLLQAFDLKQQLHLSINPQTLQLITDNAKLIRCVRKTPEARKLFFDILLSDNPETSLRLMTECGVLGRLIPEFQNIVAQVQFDMYHVYTTDEHTFKAIGSLSETPPDMMPQSRLALYLGTLLHDIGKGRGGDHAQKGAELAEKILTDLGVEKDDAETVVWLIANHLLMSQTAFRRDIFDPKTIADFVAVVQSPERLKLLYALTVADIKAVGSNVWNSFKDKLLKDLFTFALEKMQGIDSRARSLTPAQKALAEKADRKEYAFAVTPDPDRGVTEFIVLAPDRDGLFADITGTMATEDVSIIEAQIATLDNGMALDTFLIQETNMLNEKKPVDSEKKIARLQNGIKTATASEIEDKLNKKRIKTASSVLWSPPRVFINNTASDSCSLIEVNGTDYTGFLHEVTHTMTTLRLNIVSAHIYTYGSRVVDVFYVKDSTGCKITDEPEMQKIKTTLLDILNGSTSFRH
ncbi:MAG: [Alphaproteobacteria bacterium]|nr:[protein-PII] uridylyltransferase [Alphaproteobacteria bacterium]